MKKNSSYALKLFRSCLSAAALVLIFSSIAPAQNYKLTPGDTLKSVSILPDGKVTFRIYAPKATEVKIGGSDIPDAAKNGTMTKQENGVWEVTLGPVAPGAYRYNFVVDNVTILDPKNTSVSESNMNSWSLMYVPGADFMELKDVPHGAVSEVTYYSKTLNRFRRMHVYTPAGYEAGSDKYPVFYLLHGAFDCDDSWSTVGRAGIILDNLIASKKAVPMVVVMPAGHTGPFVFNAARPAGDEFVGDFQNDIKPYIEKNYRIQADRQHRAIAGLSMGGAQTLNIAIPNLEDYSYAGVFSSGILEMFRPGTQNSGNAPTYEDRNKSILENNDLKKGLSLLWFATGKEDFLLATTHSTIDMFKKYGFNVTYKETEGGHTWANWREYLNEFAPLLFRSAAD